VQLPLLVGQAPLLAVSPLWVNPTAARAILVLGSDGFVRRVDVTAGTTQPPAPLGVTEIANVGTKESVWRGLLS